MSRPQAKVIFEDYNRKTHKVFEVVEAQSVYAVFYEEKPITLRDNHKYLDSPYKYKRSNYPDKGRAVNLAKKLNTRFNTDKFTVYKLCAVEQVL
jgi:hypothetical protein